jgi:hypothetical protein
MSETDTAKNLDRILVSSSQTRLVAATTVRERICYIDEALLVAEIEDTCVAIWRAQPTEYRFERQEAALCEVIARHTDPIGFLCVVEEKTPAPSERIRKASVEMLASRKQHLACIAGVICDRGFGAAITRSVLSGMAFLLSRRDFRVTFTDTTTHAATWMNRYVNIGSVDAYCAAIESCRALSAQYPVKKVMPLQTP